MLLNCDMWLWACLWIILLSILFINCQAQVQSSEVQSPKVKIKRKECFGKRVLIVKVAQNNCCDHEDQEHRPYCWDSLLLYVQTFNTTSDGIPKQTQRQDSKPFVYSFKYTSSGMSWHKQNLENLNDVIYITDLLVVFPTIPSHSLHSDQLLTQN